MPFTYTDLQIFAPEDPDSPSDHSVYRLTPAEYRDPHRKMTPTQAAQAIELLSQGVVVANMPNDYGGAGGYCYLLNLPAIQPPPVNPGSITPKQVLFAIRGLIKRVPARDQTDSIVTELRELLKRHGVTP